MPDTTRLSANRAREIAVPAEVRSLSTLSRIDYENAILVEFDTVDESARKRAGEEWARAILDDAPADTRRALTEQWTRFGLHLGPGHSDRHVLGWPIRSSTPDRAVLGTSSDRGLHAELLIQCRPHALVFASFIQHDTDDARTLWTEVEHIHTPVMCKLIDAAVTRVARA